jgi:hypothetical protein
VVHLEKLYQQYKDHVEFAFIYISEAGHRVPDYEFLLEKPRGTTKAEQAAECRQNICRAIDKAKLSVPVFVDQPDEAAARAYVAWPARLVVVGSDGRIARDFGLLPFRGWKLDEVSRFLAAESAPQTQSEASE